MIKNLNGSDIGISAQKPSYTGVFNAASSAGPKINIFDGIDEASAHARADMVREGLGGAISMPNRSRGSESNGKDKDKNSQSSHDLLQAFLITQIARLHYDIEQLDQTIAAFQERLGEISLAVAANKNALVLGQSALDVINEHLAKGVGYQDFLKTHFKDRTFTDQPGNLFEAINNPMRDVEGNMIYEDQGLFYKLEIDAEKGIYNRSYYEDPKQILEFSSRMWNKDNPELPANYTALGRDPLNSDEFKKYFHVTNFTDENDFLNAPGCEPDEHIASFRIVSDSEVSADHKTTIKAAIVCDSAMTCVMAENEDYDLEAKKIDTKIEKATEERDAKKAELEKAERTLNGETQDSETSEDTTQQSLKSPAPAPDPTLEKIAKIKNELANDIALNMDGVIDHDGVKALALKHGIPESHLQQFATALGTAGVDVIEKLEEEPELAANIFNGFPITLEEIHPGVSTIFAAPRGLSEAASAVFGKTQLTGVPDIKNAFSLAAPPLPEPVLEHDLTLQPANKLSFTV